MIAPLPHKVTAGYPFDLGDHFYFTKTTSRVFFQDKPVAAKIVEADIGKEKAVFTVKNEKYGAGVVTITSDQNLREISDEQLKNVLLKSVSDQALSSVYLDKRSGTFHLATCNHLSPIGERVQTGMSEAIAQGAHQCGVCFYKELFLPDIELERMIERKAAAEFRQYRERVTDQGMQERVNHVGGKVLQGWPYPRIGYDYTFRVVESSEINARALAAGSIFVTTGLLASIESDDELEAVLAHEVGHVERRHSLQSYHLMLASQQAQAALQVLSSVAMGVAAGTNHSTAANIIGAATIASMVAINLHEAGFSKDQEREADEVAVTYFRKNGKDLQPLRSVFKKLMYHNLTAGHEPDPVSLSHPALGSRLSSLETGSTYFPKDAVYHTLHQEASSEFRVYSVTKRGAETGIVIAVSDFRELRNLPADMTTLGLADSHRSVEFTNFHLLPTDAWGGLLIATGTIEEINVNELQSVSFSMGVGKGVFGTGTRPASIELAKGAYY